MFQTEVRDARANAYFEAYKELGVSIQFRHESDGEYITLYAKPEEERTTWTRSEKIDIDATILKLKIPRQTGFPPESEVVTTLDDIIYNSLKWVVKEYEKDKYGALWTVTIERDRATNINGA